MTKLGLPLIYTCAQSCTNAQTYDFYGKKITVSIDWQQITKKVQHLSSRKQPVLGGLLKSSWYKFLMPSFAYPGDDASIIVLFPGNWQRKLYFSSGIKAAKSELNPHEIMAKLLAHEAKHIAQGVRGYGYKDIFVAFIYVGYIFIPISIIMTIIDPSNWTLPILYYAMYRLGLAVYFNDWRERDARNYAANHWQEWEPFITISEPT